MIFYIVALTIVFLDQFSKWLIVTNLDIGNSIRIIPGTLYLSSLRNPGGAFGILAGQLGLFIIVSVAVIGVLIYLLQIKPKDMKWYGVSLALLLGGTLGNFIDRLFHSGEVIDFINLILFSFKFPIFNIADVSLNIGIIMMLVHLAKEQRKQSPQL
ncbi:signal peptidase II [Dethiobacter alkaliphilus]|uniref:signal peptidase II n=1 Tax=Dethiobacter alkaliphilus TaxID=427926 RepID=UPI00222626ED|nr:signal peptidase II [Dethiobacter alkaliphilus]MCW3491549.1 signal peptidase II [Dethiobacter alkaliphilus]